jgi:hypothetical protein
MPQDPTSTDSPDSAGVQPSVQQPTGTGRISHSLVELADGKGDSFMLAHHFSEWCRARGLQPRKLEGGEVKSLSRGDRTRTIRGLAVDLNDASTLVRAGQEVTVILGPPIGECELTSSESSTAMTGMMMMSTVASNKLPDFAGELVSYFVLWCNTARVFARERLSDGSTAPIKHADLNKTVKANDPETPAGAAYEEGQDVIISILRQASRG